MMHSIQLMISDFKLIFREPSLRIFLLMPFLIVLIIHVGLPALVEEFPVVGDYTSYILMAASIQTSTMFGFIYCMVFIDEKDQEINKVYGILPVSKKGFVLIRMIPSLILSILFTFIVLYFQKFYILSFTEVLSISVQAGLVSPILSLVVAILSKNKMEGLTWYKVINTILNVPLIAFFIPAWDHIFGLIPSHWVFQNLHYQIAGESGLWVVGFGFIYLFFVILLLDIRFSKVHFA